MAIRWQWKDKIGEATFNHYGKEITVNIYECNGLAVFINEWEEKGEKLYNLYTFFADEQHMKNCLGLNKDTENIYKDSFKSIKVKQCKTAIKLIQNFIKAKFESDITITLQTELPF